ncbi:MAG: TRAP transporter substrate-binding protein DctP [Nitrospirae bacterium]|nr:TRAP transporter substrate-binding protein DctP [Nitrospirota bacterium]
MWRAAWVFFPAVLLALASPGAARAINLKLAIIPPEGTTWTDFVKEAATRIEQDTQGRVKITLYAGGQMGDEVDVVRKLRLGQVEAAGLTGMGLGALSPEVRVLELPLLIREYREAEYIGHEMYSTFKTTFEKKGAVLLGLAPYGGIYIFTQKPVSRLSDIAGEKAWVWAGDPLAEVIYKELGVVTPVSLSIIEVLPALQTGMVNAFYNSPLGVIALQWYSHAKYIVDTPLTMAFSGFVVSQKAWDAISAADRAVIIQRTNDLIGRLTEQVAEDNEVALRGLQKRGIRFTKFDPAGFDEFKAKMDTVHQKLVGVLYPKSLLDLVQHKLEEYRAKHP